MLALAIVALGARRLGALIGLGAILCGGQIVLEHRSLSLPTVPDRAADLRVLFFNALGGNAAYGYRIVEAALQEAPDVIVFAEAAAIYPALRKLKEHYTFVSPCSLEACEMVVATRKRPERFWRLSLNLVWDNRYAVAALGDETPVFVAASHIAKPWLVGISEGELARLAAQYDWLPGPVVALGDFNAAPWSLPMRRLMRQSGMRMLRWPHATWPARFGRLGLPIDHVLVRDGARVVRVRPFGAGLNSNHLGLVADIALP